MKKNLRVCITTLSVLLLYIVLANWYRFINYRKGVEIESYVSLPKASANIANEVITAAKKQIPGGLITQFDEKNDFIVPSDMDGTGEKTYTEISAALLREAKAQKYKFKIAATADDLKIIIEKLKKLSFIYDAEALQTMENLGGSAMPRYYIRGELKWKNKHDVYINVALKKIAGGVTEIQTVSDFLTDEYIEREKAVKGFITGVSSTLDYGLLVAYAAAAAAFVYLLYLLLWIKGKTNEIVARADEKLAEIQKHINNKSFSSADEILQECLDYAPGAADFKARFSAVKNRLEIVVRQWDKDGNPNKAEANILQLETLKKKVSGGMPLEQKEKQILAQLPAHEADAVREAAEQIESAKHIRQEAQQICITCESMMDRGNIRQAKAEAERQMRKNFDEPVRERLKELIKDIEVKIKENEKKFKEARVHIENLEFGEAKELLLNIKDSDKEFVEASELLGAVEESEKTEVFSLEPEKIGKKLVIFKKDAVMFARRDSTKPDVVLPDEMRKVSRDKHFKMAVVDTKVIGENFGQNGTYVRGENIKKSEIEDGDIVDIAHMYQMTVRISRGEAGGDEKALRTIQGTMVDDATMDVPVKISQKNNSKKSREVSGVFLEANDSNYIMLVKSVPVAFKAVGILYDESASLFFGVENGVAFLTTPDGAQILRAGASVGHKGIKYKVN